MSYAPEPRWDTVGVSRLLLAIARTVTSVNRLLDVLPVVGADPRVQIVFTVEDGSQFSDGVVDRVRAAGFRLIPWRQAVQLRFDLVISASDKGNLGAVTGPLLLLPHGVGYHRRSPHGVSGLTFPMRRDDGTTVVVAHPGQLDQLRDVSPRAARQALVAGDPCLDRMLASVALRNRYRRAFDTEGRRLVVLSSTWGRFSLLGNDPTLPARMLAELPIDEYRVAAALHPNVWARHGPWQVRQWLADAIDAGLLLVAPDEGWRAALIAADVVVADHGSVTCYAAALGKPVLLAADGAGEVVPESPMDTLRATLPQLDNAFAAQFERVLREHDPVRTVALTEPIFAHHQEATARLRTTVYQLLRLPPPNTATPTHPIPVPTIARHTPAGLIVRATLSRLADNHITVDVHRTPAAVHERWNNDPRPVHLVAHLDDDDLPVNQSAAVLVADEPAATLDTARAWATRTLTRFPGARITAARTTDGIALRIRPDIELHLVPREAGTDEAAWASAVYACVVSGMKLIEIDQITLRAGPISGTADLTM